MSECAIWLPIALSKLQELSQLPSNWDSYNSRPISRAALAKAAEVLRHIADRMPAPDIFPVPGGGIQMEWSNDGYEKLEIGILPTGDIEYECTGQEAPEHMKQYLEQFSKDSRRASVILLYS